MAAVPLRSGTTPTTTTDVLLVRSGVKGASITKLRLATTAPADVVVDVSIKRSGQSPSLYAQVTVPGGGGSADLLHDVPLSAGDSVQLLASAATCDYTLFGIA